MPIRMGELSILHFSDVHFGPYLHPGGPGALRAEVERHRPDLVVVSGDLTQRAKPRPFRAARAFLDGLGVPFLAIPGNHDIPLYPVHRRAFTPYRQFRKKISPQREPLVRVGDVAFVGLDTTAHYLVVEGHARLGRRERWLRRFRELPGDVVKVAVAHHPLLPPPGDAHSKHLLYGGRALAAGLVEAGCRLVLGGHLHVSFIRDAGEVWPEAKGLWVAQAGTSSSIRGRGRDAGARSYARVTFAGTTARIERWRTEGEAPFVLVESRDCSLDASSANP